MSVERRLMHGTCERTPSRDSASEVLFTFRERLGAKRHLHCEFMSRNVLCLVLLRAFSKNLPITVPNAPCQDLHIEGLSER
jgi:hypothetical protein